MINLIDKLLDRITMYKLVYYYLLALVAAAMVLAALGVVSYSPIAIAAEAAYLWLACWGTNKAIAYVLEVPINPESSYITALILALIITPPPSAQGYVFLTAAAGLAVASKYLLTIKNHSVFNPAAIAVVLTAFGAGDTASWWVGSSVFAPLVIIGGLLVIRKVRRVQMVASFFVGAIISTTVFVTLAGGDVAASLRTLALNSSLLFFAFVMLTEPLTAPTAAAKQRWYGLLAGILLPPQVHVLGVYSTPELALVISNLFSYAIEQKSRLLLRLSGRQQIGQNLVDFVFKPDQKLNYLPGQYMEWTLPHARPDARGGRRYFTLASSPTEAELRVGVKFYPNGSSYKRVLLGLGAGSVLAAGQLGGEFTLPKDPSQKLVFIAGGIGVTPFRSMIKYLIDTGQTRDIVLIYGMHDSQEIAYADVFAEAKIKFGLRVAYVMSLPDVTADNIYRGPITTEVIGKLVPDFAERTFYVSGSQPMVAAMKGELKALGVSGALIKTDLFAGFA